MNLNNKGFTLIEVISVVIILGIIVSLVIPSLFGYFDTTKEKSEEIFSKQLSKIIDDYVSLEGSKIKFDNTNYKLVKKCNPFITDDCKEVKVYKNITKVTFQNLIDANLTKEKDIINPNDSNNDNNCDLNTEITVYKDEEYVYCFETKPNCLKEENFINTCSFKWEELS